MDESKSERTRKFIIEASAPIFNMKGYSGTSISDIVSETGLTKGAIYGNFENKDELALAALEYNLKWVSGILFSEAGKEKNSCMKLTVFAESYRKHHEFFLKRGGCPVMNAAVDSDDGHPLIKKRVEKFIKTWKKALMQIVEAGKADKEIKPDADSERFSNLFISLIEGSVTLSTTMGDRKYLDMSVDHIISLVDDLKNI